MKLVISLMSGLVACSDEDSETEVRELLNDAAEAAGYQSAAPGQAVHGFAKFKAFHVGLKKLLRGKWKRHHLDVMARPNVKAAWNAANTVENTYMTDLLVDTAEDNDPEEPGDFAAFWEEYYKNFLEESDTPWHVIHRERYHNPKYAMKDNDTVAQFYDSKFKTMAVKESSCSALKAASRAYLAVTFFAGLTLSICAAMPATFANALDPSKLEDWDIDTLYKHAQAVEKDPAFKASQEFQRSTNKKLNTRVGAVSTDSGQAKLLARVAALEAGGTSNRKEKSDYRVRDNESRDANQKRREQEDAVWKSIGRQGQEDYRAQRALVSKSSEAVAGTNGITKTWPKKDRDGKVTRPGRLHVCMKLDLSGGCGKPGHQWWNCKHTDSWKPFTSKGKSTTAAIAPTTGNDLDGKLNDMMKMILMSCGDDDDVNAIAAKHGVQLAPITILVGASTNTSTACTIKLDDDQRWLVDTGSPYTIMNTSDYQRDVEAGTATEQHQSALDVSFSSASAGDLGYTADGIKSLAVCGGREPATVRLCDNLDLPGIDGILGMDMLEVLDANIKMRTNAVSLEAQGMPATEYKFKKPVVEPRVRPPAQQPVQRRGNRRSNAPVTPVRTISSWCTALAILLTATIPINAINNISNHTSLGAVNSNGNGAGHEIPLEVTGEFMDSPVLHPFSNWTPAACNPFDARASDPQSLVAPVSADATGGDPAYDTCKSEFPNVDGDVNWAERDIERNMGATKTDGTSTMPLNAKERNELLSQYEQLWMVPDDNQSNSYGLASFAESVASVIPTEQGCTTVRAQYDPTGVLLDTTFIDVDYVTGRTSLERYGGRRGVVEPEAKPVPWPNKAEIELATDCDYVCSPIVAAAYRDITGDAVWEKMGLDVNEWANQKSVKQVLKPALEEYSKVFESNPDGSLKRVCKPDGSKMQVHIPIDPNVTVRSRAFRVNKRYSDCMEEECRGMLKLKVITPCHDSDCSSPALCIPKPDKTIRMVADFRNLNKYITSYSYPLVTEQDVFSRMGGCTRFSTIDMSKWFWQFELDEVSKNKTCFVTPTMGSFRYEVLPMGLNISPAVVQSFLDDVFRVPYTGPGPMQNKMALGNIVISYLDDVHIFSDDKYHAHYVKWVLERLHLCNVQIRPDKCHIGMSKIHALGHIIDGQGLHMDPTKIEAINALNAPTDKTGIKRILGMAGYYRKFIEHFGGRTAKMTDALKKTTRFDWTVEMQAELDDIKAAMTKAPILALPRWNLPYIVRSDASDRGLGCTLCQEVDGVRRIVAAASRKFNDAERKKDTRWKEARGMMYAIRKFKQYLQGAHFEMHTDHRNLLWLKNVSSDTPQLYRWSVELSALDFTLKHVAGSSLHDSDTLSRDPMDAVEGDPAADDSWEGYSITSSTRGSTTAKAKTNTFNVFHAGIGVGTAVMAMANTPFVSIGGCDSNTAAVGHFANRTDAPTHGAVSALITRLEAGAKLPPVDVMVCKPVWGQHWRPTPDYTDSLADYERSLGEHLKLVALAKPTACVLDLQQPTCPASNALCTKMEMALTEMGYDVKSDTLQYSRQGDYTDGSSYVAVATKTKTPFEFQPELDKFGGCRGIMEEAAAVPLTSRSQDHTACRRSRNNSDSFNSNKIGTVTRGCNASGQGTVTNGLYDPDYPMPSIQPGVAWGGGRGSQWVNDSVGPRQWSLNEECALHNIDETAKQFLHTMPEQEALQYVAESTPVATLSSLFKPLLRCLQADIKRESVSFNPIIPGKEISWTTGEAAPGWSHLHRDVTLEATSDEAIRVMADTVFEAMPTQEDIKKSQQADPDIAPLLEYHKHNKDEKFRPTGTYHKDAPFTHLSNGIVFYRNELGEGEVLVDAAVIPKALTTKVLRALHNSPHYCHAGIAATMHAVQERCYWKGMRRDVIRHVTDCTICKRAKCHRKANAGKHKSCFYRKPFSRFGMDLIGPFVECEGMVYVLHVLDWATSFNYCFALPDKKARTVAEALNTLFCTFGYPEELVSDNGTEFCNSVVTALEEIYNVKRIKISPLSPKSNSRTERRHRDYNAAFRIAVNRFRKTWLDSLVFINWALNIRPRPGTNVTPFELLFGFKPATPDAVSLMDSEAQLSVQRKHLSDEEWIRNTAIYRNQTMDIVERAWETVCNRNRHYNEVRRYERSYNLGDYVILYRTIMKHGHSTRLLWQNIGPFEVVEKLPMNAYRLRKLGTDKITLHNVKDMYPYLTKEAHERGVPLDDELPNSVADDQPDVLSGFTPKEGDFLFLTALCDKADQYYLVEVAKYQDNTEIVTFAYTNNTQTPGKLRNFRYVWLHDGKNRGETKKPAKEIQSMEAPKVPGYKQDLQSAPLGYFCRKSVMVKKSKLGYQISKAEAKDTLTCKPHNNDHLHQK
jgi:hypothetical protein